MTIRNLDSNETGALVDVLRRSCATVAERFGLTQENCPRHIAFYTPERLKEDVDRGMRFYVWEDDGRICGCVALEPAKPGVCYLGRLAVLPEHRGRGHGQALVQHALEQAREIGVNRVEIGIISEDSRLKDWYGRFGFLQTGTKTFDHLPFVVAFMALEL